MVRSTDTKSRSHLWFTAAAFVLAVNTGFTIGVMWWRGASAKDWTILALLIIGALACAYVAINACLARRRACDELRQVRAEGMAQAAKDLAGAGKFVTTHRDEATTDVQLVRFPDGFVQLLVDLQCEAYDACYNTRPNASWLSVGDALERVLDAAEVPARAMRRPRGQFIPVRS